MISDTGYWIIDEERFNNEHIYCSILSDKIVNYVQSLKVQKIYDFGCGPGKYVENLRNNGNDVFHNK